MRSKVGSILNSNQRVVFQPDSHLGLQRGIHAMVTPIRSTLGPIARTVAVADYLSHKSPEIIDNGAVIARRLVQLQDTDADMGAMLVRDLLWELHESVGDSTATAAVIFQSIYDQGLKFLAAGGNAMQLRHHLEFGASLIRKELSNMIFQIEGKDQLTKLAMSICHDQELANYLGEIMSIIGQHGQVDIRSGNRRETVREYVDGAYWDWGLFTREMLTNGIATTLNNPAILLTDFEIDDPRDLMPPLESAIHAGYRSMLIIARQISDKALGLLVNNNKREKFHTLAVKIPGQFNDPAEMLEDMGLMTGAKVLLRAKGDALTSVTADDLGQCEEIWVDLDNFGLITDEGNHETIDAYIQKLDKRFQESNDQDARQRLQERLGKLMGGSALLWVGGSTSTELKSRKELAERTLLIMRNALHGGVLPGGGTSLLACQTSIQQHLSKQDGVEARAACHILVKTLEQPFRTILDNAGYEASAILGEIRTSDCHSGFDVLTGEYVDMMQTGIYDVAEAYITSVCSAITSVALALTIETLVHCNP